MRAKFDPIAPLSIDTRSWARAELVPLLAEHDLAAIGRPWARRADPTRRGEHATLQDTGVVQHHGAGPFVRAPGAHRHGEGQPNDYGNAPPHTPTTLHRSARFHTCAVEAIRRRRYAGVVPMLDTADALTLASAIAAAVAALAACAAVGLDLWRDHKSHIPHVSAQAGRPIDGGGPTLALSNAGPGVAIGLVYFGVDGAYRFGDGVGSGGHLMPFGETTERVALPDWTAERPTFVYSCRDIRGVLHLWTSDNRRHQSRPKPGAWPTAGEQFRIMFPDVAIPDNIWDTSARVEWR